MAMPRISNAQLGALNLLMYDYRAAGDTLPMHNHDDRTSHIIIVAKGRVMIRVANPDGSVENSIHGHGSVVDTFAGFPHEVISLTRDARTIHIGKAMTPPPAQEAS